MMETLSTPMSASSFIGAIKLIIKFKVQHSKFKVKKMSNRFTSRLSDDDDFKRDELIRKIEHSVEQMTLSELEALSYDMFTKGYMEDYCIRKSPIIVLAFRMPFPSLLMYRYFARNGSFEAFRAE